MFIMIKLTECKVNVKDMNLILSGLETGMLLYLVLLLTFILLKTRNKQ